MAHMSRATTEPFPAFFARSEGWTVRPYLWHLKRGCTVGAATDRLIVIVGLKAKRAWWNW